MAAGDITQLSREWGDNRGLVGTEEHYVSAQVEPNQHYLRPAYHCSCGKSLSVSLRKDGKATAWSHRYWRIHLENVSADRDELIEVAVLQRSKTRVRYSVCTAQHPLTSRLAESYRTNYIRRQDPDSDNGILLWCVITEVFWANGRLSTSMKTWTSSKKEAISDAKKYVRKEIENESATVISGYNPGSSATLELKTASLNGTVTALLARCDEHLQAPANQPMRRLQLLQELDLELGRAESFLNLVQAKRTAVVAEISEAKKALLT